MNLKTLDSLMVILLGLVTATILVLATSAEAYSAELRWQGAGPACAAVDYEIRVTDGDSGFATQHSVAEALGGSLPLPDAGGVFTYTHPGLPDDSLLEFCVVSVCADGRESVCSNKHVVASGEAAQALDPPAACRVTCELPATATNALDILKASVGAYQFPTCEGP